MPTSSDGDSLIYFLLFSLMLHGLILLVHIPEEKRINSKGLEIVFAGSKGLSRALHLSPKPSNNLLVKKEKIKKENKKALVRKKAKPRSPKAVKTKRQIHRRKQAPPRPVKKKEKASPIRRLPVAVPVTPMQDKTVAATVEAKAPPPKKPAAMTHNPSALLGLTARTAASDVKGRYLALIRRIIEAHKYYPYNARVFGRQGKVTVSFSIDERGSIDLVQIVSKCPYRDLNKAAIKTLHCSAPLPPPPPELKPPLRIKIDLVFKLDS